MMKYGWWRSSIHDRPLLLLLMMLGRHSKQPVRLLLLLVDRFLIVGRLMVRLVVVGIITLIITWLLYYHCLLSTTIPSSVLNHFHFRVGLFPSGHNGTNTNQQEYSTDSNGTNGPIGKFITTATVIIVVIASVSVGTVWGLIRAVAIVVATVLGAIVIIAIAVGHLQLYFYSINLLHYMNLYVPSFMKFPLSIDDWSLLVLRGSSIIAPRLLD